MAEKQFNLNSHDEKQFDNIVNKGLIEGGIHLNAMKNFGKSRLMFAICAKLQPMENVRCLSFAGSEAWL